MPLKNIQLAQISTSNKGANKFTVTVYSDDGNSHATFECDGQTNAVVLRNAIRYSADRLVTVFRSDPDVDAQLVNSRHLLRLAVADLRHFRTQYLSDLGEHKDIEELIDKIEAELKNKPF